MRKLIIVGLAQTLFLLAGCGGGSGSLATGGGGGGGGTGSTPTNTVAITVDDGPDPQAGYDADTPFITVTVCAPGSTTNCQTIDHVEIDTGSYGLRLMSSVLNSSLASALQSEQGAGGEAIVECTQFVDGFSWGPVALADVQIAGESASSVPMQVIGDPSYESEIPAACSGTGTEEDSVAAFGANGILGIGPFADDCGPACALSATSGENPGWYYTCPSGGTSTTDCAEAAVSESSQVTDPVADFQTDNNGVIVEIASATDGALTDTGTLIFGIGTESNNAITTQTVLTADPNYGDISTTYDTQDGNDMILPFSYIDTGSNAYYFADGGIPSDAACSTQTGYDSSNPQTWFCPASELKLSALNSGQNGLQSTVSFSVGDAYQLFNTYQTGTVFDDLGASSGPEPQDCSASTTDFSCAFDFGFPFFLGKDVYVAFAGAITTGGTGPYFAY
ncbi:MAG: DUF3443 family protein [Steroidobacteraceae bacterium]